jgi:hypothetical protein
MHVPFYGEKKSSQSDGATALSLCELFFFFFVWWTGKALP